MVIAQRLTTVMNADRIYVLDGGHVVETGNYQTLMAANGVSALWPAASSPRLLASVAPDPASAKRGGSTGPGDHAQERWIR